MTLTPRIFFTILLSVLMGTALQAQSVKTILDRKDILIGEPINYSIVFTLPANSYSIDFNIPDSLPHFEVMDKVKSDSADKQGNYVVQQKLKLTSWDSGQWAIPSFAVKLKSAKSGDAFTLNTDQVMINVGYAPADSTGQLRDIKPPMNVLYIDRTWYFIAAGVLVFLILAFLLYRYLRRRAKRPKAIFESKLSPVEEARQALAALQQQRPAVQEEAKVWFTQLSNIFKKYYSRKKQQNLLNKTTGEVLLLLKEQAVPVTEISDAANAFRIGDAAKFARYMPAQTEFADAIMQVQALIDAVEKLNTSAA